jgi:glycosyltransferase involved in cell wall biosynthesis
VRRLNTGVLRWFALRAERHTYRSGRCRLLAAVSEGGAAEVRRWYPSVPVVVTPNGTDVERFGADPVVRDEERAQHGTPPWAFVVLFVGGEWGRKGLVPLVQAVGLLHDGFGARLELWVVGRGTWPASERAPGCVRFLGERSDVERVYAAADALCLPSSYETFSLVAHEAAACGLPLVATHVHGVDELIGEDEGGGLWVSQEPLSIAGALSTLAADAGLCRRLGDTARRRSEGCTWERSAGSVAACWDALLDGQPPAAVGALAPAGALADDGACP